MKSNKEFYKSLEFPRARFFLCDLHVHSPASLDVVSDDRFSDLSTFEAEKLGELKGFTGGQADYETTLLEGNYLTPEEYLAQLVERRDAVLDEIKLSEEQPWAIIGITDHNVCTYACKLAQLAWDQRADTHIVVLPGIELDVEFPVPECDETTSAHILLLFEPGTTDRGIHASIRETSEKDWDFGTPLKVDDLAAFVHGVRHHKDFPGMVIAAHLDTGKGVQTRTTTALKRLNDREAAYARLTGELADVKANANTAGSTWETKELEYRIADMEQEVETGDSISLKVLSLIGACGFDALQVQRDFAARHYRRLHRFDGTAGRAVPIVCSDAHKIDDIFECKNAEVPFLKLPQMTSSSKPSLIFSDIRDRAIRYGETRFAYRPSGPVVYWISGIEISRDSTDAKDFWPFEADGTFTLPLSRNLNCFIGGRGSGKSAAIEAISFASQNQYLGDRGNGPYLEDCQRRAAATLTGCNVRLCWTYLDKDKDVFPKGAVFTTRFFASSGKHKDVACSDMAERDIHDVPPAIEVFRLHQIEELVEKPEQLLRLFDDLCGQEVGDKNDEIEALRSTLVEQRTRLLDTARQLFKLTKEGAPLQTYVQRKQQYDAVNSTDVRKKYERLDDATTAATAISKTSDAWLEIEDLLDVDTRKVEINEFFGGIDKVISAESDDPNEFITPLRSLVEADAGGESPKSSLLKAVDALQKSADGVASTVVEAKAKVDVLVDEEKRKLSQDGLPVGGKDREAKKSEFDEVVSDLERYRALLLAWSSEMDARKITFAKLVAAAQSRTDIRKTKAAEITQRLRAELDPDTLVIEVDAKPMADKTEFSTWIDSHLYPPNTQAKSSRTEAFIADGLSPEKLRQVLLGETPLPSVTRASVKDGLVLREHADSFTEHAWGMRTLSPGKDKEDIDEAAHTDLPEEITKGLKSFPAMAGDEVTLDEKRLSAVLNLDEIVFNDLPEVKLMDRPTEMTEGRPLLELSPGQRCSAILPILLLNGVCPLVIDQPEDNLDNRLVREVVVKILASIKLQRQVIIATHNPNLPVLGDVEQSVILRAVKDSKCEVQATGNLDDRGVVRLITDIMEGGREAFQYRHAIYRPYWEGPVDASADS